MNHLQSLKKSIGQLIRSPIFIFCLLLLLCCSLFKVTLANGPSMEPTYHTGNIILNIRKFREPSIGDVVLIRRNNRYYIKRIAATPGGAAEAPAMPDPNAIINGYPIPNSAYLLGTDEQNGCTTIYRDPSDSSDLLDNRCILMGWENTGYWTRYHYWADSIMSRVPEDYYFVTGDNLPHSSDSRDPNFGLIHKSEIWGYPLFTIR